MAVRALGWVTLSSNAGEASNRSNPSPAFAGSVQTLLATLVRGWGVQCSELGALRDVELPGVRPLSVHQWVGGCGLPLCPRRLLCGEAELDVSLVLQGWC